MQLYKANSISANFDDLKCQIRALVEKYLSMSFSRYADNEVVDAARYVVLGGGHRWRAIAAIVAGQIFRDDALEVVLPGACAVELAHGASLLLDDLPSM